MSWLDKILLRKLKTEAVRPASLKVCGTNVRLVRQRFTQPS